MSLFISLLSHLIIFTPCLPHEDLVDYKEVIKFHWFQVWMLTCVHIWEREKETCSLETTWTGPMFTDTYFPLDDTFCLTRPCWKHEEMLIRLVWIPIYSILLICLALDKSLAVKKYISNYTSRMINIILKWAWFSQNKTWNLFSSATKLMQK